MNTTGEPDIQLESQWAVLNRLLLGLLFPMLHPRTGNLHSPHFLILVVHKSSVHSVIIIIIIIIIIIVIIIKIIIIIIIILKLAQDERTIQAD